MKAIDKLLLWEDEALLLSLSTRNTPNTFPQIVSNTVPKIVPESVQNNSDQNSSGASVVKVDENGERAQLDVEVEVEVEVYSDIDSSRVSTNTSCVLKALKHMQRQQTLTQSLSQEEAVADFPAGECCPECFFVN